MKMIFILILLLLSLFANENLKQNLFNKSEKEIIINFKKDYDFSPIEKYAQYLYIFKSKKKTINFLKKFISKYPFYKYAYKVLAMYQVYIHNIKDARKSLKKIGLKDEEIDFEIAKYLAWNGDFELSKKIFLKIIKNSKNKKLKIKSFKYMGFIYYWNGDYKKAKKYFNEYLKFYKSDEVNEALMVIEKKYQYLIKKYEKLYKSNPDNIQYIYKLALYNQKAGNIKKAIKFYEVYYGKNPLDISVLRELGILYLRLKNEDVGFNYLKKYAQITQTFLAYKELYNHYIWFNKIHEAQNLFLYMSQKFKNNKEFIIFREKHYYKMYKIFNERKEYKKAIKYLEKIKFVNCQYFYEYINLLQILNIYESLEKNIKEFKIQCKNEKKLIQKIKSLEENLTKVKVAEGIKKDIKPKYSVLDLYKLKKIKIKNTSQLLSKDNIEDKIDIEENILKNDKTLEFDFYHYSDKDHINFYNKKIVFSKIFNDKVNLHISPQIWKLIDDESLKGKTLQTSLKYSNYNFGINFDKFNSKTDFSPYFQYETTYKKVSIRTTIKKRNYGFLKYRKYLFDERIDAISLDFDFYKDIDLKKKKYIWASIEFDKVDDGNKALTAQFVYQYLFKKYYSFENGFIVSGWYHLNSKTSDYYYSPKFYDSTFLGIETKKIKNNYSFLFKPEIGYSFKESSFLYQISSWLEYRFDQHSSIKLSFIQGNSLSKSSNNQNYWYREVNFKLLYRW
ncbi:tetratricopeptide repeat protein [Nitrosophilus kaiyonis]|uniref:tetratricopeptide repeat protein n=1 Tax=Nitrosophilus kaiyonis TaxID=2930200 RepID=UPI002493481B|nr:hypothetical protein [Nitrosophilus kaiyonis]